MIDEQSLMEFSGYFADSRQLEKDYLLNLMLKVISINKISERLVFKGGTALHYFYGLDRFSEDLDFTYIGREESVIETTRAFEDVRSSYGAMYNIRKSKRVILEKDARGNTVGLRSEFFIEGPLFQKTRVSHKIKVDVSTRGDLIDAPLRPSVFVSGYRDIGSILVYVMDKDEILTEKLCAIAERTKARDVYDAYFLIRHLAVKYSGEQFEKKLVKRNESYSIDDVKLAIRKFDGGLWKEELSYLVGNLPNLSEVSAYLLKELR